jgi:DNA polymerase-3 subunit delta'
MNGEARETFLKSAGTAVMQSAYLVICSRPVIANRAVNDFLMKLFCKNGGCGGCPECRNVLQGHVDIMRLNAPKVDEFREAIAFVAEKPSGTYKAVVIENADDMTDAAANSMLKTLEQPPTNTVFLLEARSVAGVLPTVASRCAAVHITPDADSERAIAKSLGVDAISARILYDLSGGFVEEAERIYKDREFWEARPQVLDFCCKLLYQSGFGISKYADFLEAAKNKLIPLLNVMQSYYRDIIIYKKTKNERLIINCDRVEEITKAAADFTSGAISNIIKVILEAERRFFFSVNFRLAVEKMFFDILEEKSRWKKS